jgi:hypothetical protein
MTPPQPLGHAAEPRATEPEPSKDAAQARVHDLDFALPAPAKVTSGRAVFIAVLAVALLGGVFAASYLPMRRDRQALEAGAKEHEVKTPRVELVTPTVAASQRSLLLPGSVRALEETVV